MSPTTLAAAIILANRVFGFSLPARITGILADMWKLPVTMTPVEPKKGEAFRAESTEPFHITPTISGTVTFTVPAED